jgi:Flp pilus assembly protein TadG
MSPAPPFCWEEVSKPVRNLAPCKQDLCICHSGLGSPLGAESTERMDTRTQCGFPPTACGNDSRHCRQFIRDLVTRPLVRSLRRTELGQGMVELALILPVVLLLVLGVIDLGMGFRTYITLTNAAREGARWVTVHPTDPNGALARVAVEANRAGLANTGSPAGGIQVTFTPLQSTYTAGQEVTVTVRHNHQLMFGLVTGLPEVPFRAATTMVVLYSE